MSREIKWLGQSIIEQGTRYQEYDPRTGAAIGSPMTQAEYSARSGLRPFTRVRAVVRPIFEKHRIQLTFAALPNNPFADLGWFYGAVSPYPGAPATTAAFREFVCQWLQVNAWWGVPSNGISVFVDGVKLGSGFWAKHNFCF